MRAPIDDNPTTHEAGPPLTTTANSNTPPSAKGSSPPILSANQTELEPSDLLSQLGVRRYPMLRQTLVVGMLAGVLVALAGSLLILLSPAHYVAEATMLVLPANSDDDVAEASFYETLGRGQIVATIAELVRIRAFEIQAVDRLNSEDPDPVDVEVRIVPDTSIIAIEVSGPDPQHAEDVAGRTVGRAAAYVDDLQEAFSARVLDRSEGTAVETGPDRKTSLFAVGIVALATGVAFQQAALHIGEYRQRGPAPTG